MLLSFCQLASEVIMSYSSNWIMLLLLCTSAPLVLCCDRFDRGSRQVKRDPVDLVTEDYDITLRWRIPKTFWLLLLITCEVEQKRNQWVFKEINGFLKINFSGTIGKVNMNVLFLPVPCLGITLLEVIRTDQYFSIFNISIYQITRHVILIHNYFDRE